MNMPKRTKLERVMAAIESDPASSTRHWSEVKRRAEESLKLTFLRPTQRAMYQRDLDAAIAKLAQLGGR